MFQNCFISKIIYIYIISLKCGIQPQLQHTGYLIYYSNLLKKDVINIHLIILVVTEHSSHVYLIGESDRG
jgi:hypothetical protein